MRGVITEADIPLLAGELAIAAGSIVTPSARDLARERGVSLREMASGELPEPHASRALAMTMQSTCHRTPS